MKIEDVLNALFAYYIEYGENKPLEYTYGYMDALSVIQEIINKHGFGSV